MPTEAERIRQEIGNRIRELDIIKTDDICVLRGRARCFYHKQLAQSTAQKLLADCVIQNEIEVD